MYQDKEILFKNSYKLHTSPPPKGNKTLMHTFVVFCGVAGSTWGILLGVQYEKWEMQIRWNLDKKKECTKTLTNVHN